MMPLLFLAAASADLDALDQAVTRCDRTRATPVFAAEAQRRSQFLVNAYREQEAILNARVAIAEQRRVLRDSGIADAAEKQRLDAENASLDDRLNLLNHRRSLEAARQQAMDAMRHYFLLNCPAGKLD
ncbi:MAG TPA: hypothetical protein VFP53_02485 [Sphingomicrobium sp.]|nr:hypothetical protein [Sphingomicrobium sp.]